MTGPAARVVLRGLEGIRRGRLEVELPDGTRRRFGGDRTEERERPGGGAGDDRAAGVPRARIRVGDRRFFRRFLLRGQVGAGDSYIRGEWDAERLADVVQVAALNRGAFRRAAPLAWVGGIVDRARHLVRANTRLGSRRNVHAHYDLGDDFFASFLDPSMTYSCALFGEGGRSLEEAQRAKHRRIADLAGLQPGDHVLDVGCGWGAFAEYAARERGCRVTGVTISRRQLAYARRRMEREGLSDRVRILDRDYRELGEERYDRVVSIEMLEAVGHRHLPGFFAACDRALAPGGRAVLQVITVPDDKYALYRLGTDYIRRFVFPGSHLPSLGALVEAMAERTSFQVRDVGTLAPDYAETLRRWRRRFERAHGGAAGGTGGLNRRLYRLWRFYLAYCEGGFRAREIDDLQIVLARPGRAGGAVVPAGDAPGAAADGGDGGKGGVERRRGGAGASEAGLGRRDPAREGGAT